MTLVRALVDPIARPLVGALGDDSSSAWTPAALGAAGMYTWHRADFYVPGATATLTDISGNGKNLTQGTAAAQPTASTLNGQASLSFDGGDFLQGALSGSLSKPFTQIIVVKLNATGVTYVLSTDDTGDVSSQLSALNTNTWNMNAGVSVSGGATSTSTTALLVVWNGASSLLYSANNWSSAAISGDSGTSTLNGITLGANQAGGSGLSGSISESLFLPGSISETNKTLFKSYLLSRYGLVIT